MLPDASEAGFEYFVPNPEELLHAYAAMYGLNACPTRTAVLLVLTESLVAPPGSVVDGFEYLVPKPEVDH